MAAPLELDWAPSVAQTEHGNFEAAASERRHLKPLVVFLSRELLEELNTRRIELEP